MGNSDLIKTGSTSVIEKGMDVIKDPNASKSSKIAAVGMLAIGAIGTVAWATINAMKDNKG